MKHRQDNTVHMIPLSDIEVVDPRQRGQKKFQQIVHNIAALGLKKPITVTPKHPDQPNGKFYLVCGQGRLEAYQSLGQNEIPALIVRVTREKLFLMSLVENLARRMRSSAELMSEIGCLHDRGYSFQDIAKKTDLDPGYIRSIIKLIIEGEERLLSAVEQGKIPINIAMTIATADDHDVQRALTEAYEKNDLRGKRLLAARRLIETRRAAGKKMGGRIRRNGTDRLSSKKLLQTYEEETARQRLVIQKSKLCETRLLFVVSALRQLFGDEQFLELLRSEQLDTLPGYLNDQLLRKDGPL
ncbi:ParB/RepB/Spo0J family partition protein [Aeoliella sp. SH292]|uniref:ParB/RepB/Spo0J family partition protein n=1 Tax=Aeoliella sp. SH292 TaxID=3454464 RepID=UPI003F94D8C1